MPDIEISSPKYLIPLVFSLGSDCFAGYGFYFLIQVQPTPGADYSTVLSILSLLTAGVVAGKFAFSHQDVATDERVLATARSTLFLLLFYTFFGAVAFYSGISEKISEAPMIHIFIPVIMATLLITNTIHDYWDYLERDE